VTNRRRAGVRDGLEIHEVHPADYVRSDGRRASTLALSVDGAQRLVFVSGQVAFDRMRQVVGEGDLATQLSQAYRNIEAIVLADGASMANVVSLRTFLVDVAHVEAYRDRQTQLHHEIWGDGPYPTNTLVVVSGLADPRLLVEVEAVAVA